MSKLIKLLNRGKSTIHGTHHADGRKYAFRPNTAAAFHEVDAKKLQRLYPLAIQSLEDVQRTFDDKPADRKTSAQPVADALAAPDAPPPAAPVASTPEPEPAPAAPAPVTPPPADPVAPAAPADGETAPASGQGDPAAA